jgi:hypothetical protein
MMHVPKILENVWWRQKSWCDYGAKLFAFYSLKRHYRLRFNTSVSTALVSDAQRLVAVNPIWPALPKGASVRFLEYGVAFHVAMLKGFLGHEAGHVRFSGEKPPGLLGDVWNALEDERIERLMVRDHAELEHIFTMMGDLFASQAHASGNMKGQTLEGVLYWRWCHDQPQRLWQAKDQTQWERIRLLVEAAWVALNSDEVKLIAKTILRVLGVPEDAPSDARFTTLTSSGSGEAGGTGEALDVSEADDSFDEPVPPPLEHDETLDELAAILVEVEPYVRELANALQPPRKVVMPQPTRSRGRFSFERYVAKSERIFRAKPLHVQRPHELRVCVDVSGSMGEADDATSGLYAVRRLCVLLEQTCHLTKIPLTVVAFNDEAWVVRDSAMSNDEALQGLVRLESSGGTELAKGLELASQSVTQRCLCFVLCDGYLSEEDEAACINLVRSSSMMDYLPVLLSDATDARDTYQHIFKRYLCVAEISDVPKLVKAWLLAQGQRF